MKTPNISYVTGHYKKSTKWEIVSPLALQDSLGKTIYIDRGIAIHRTTGELRIRPYFFQTRKLARLATVKGYSHVFKVEMSKDRSSIAKVIKKNP
jgi:hypothetical protein